MKTKIVVVLFVGASLAAISRAQDYKRAEVAPYPLLKVWETFPSWMNNGDVLFYTSRSTLVNGKKIIQPLIDENGDSGKTEGLALFSPTFGKEPLRLLLNMPDRGTAASVSPDGRKIAFSSWTKIGIIDLNASAISAINRNRVFRFDVSWSPDGKQLVMSGTHSPTDMIDKNYQYAKDIFIADIKQKPSAVPVSKTRNIARLRGVDKLPLFSPDGKWVYFAHQEPIKEFEGVSGSREEFLYRQPKNWFIYRVSANELKGKDNIAEKIVGGLSEPNRISFFPGGKKLLLSFVNEYRIKSEQGQLSIIDVEKKSVASHKLKPFTVLTKIGIKPLIPNQVALSHDGKRLAFSALLWSGKMLDEGWICIYTCDLNGDKLVRITPVDASPLPLFRYGQSDLTPLNAWDTAFKTN